MIVMQNSKQMIFNFVIDQKIEKVLESIDCKLVSHSYIFAADSLIFFSIKNILISAENRTDMNYCMNQILKDYSEQYSR